MQETYILTCVSSTLVKKLSLNITLIKYKIPSGSISYVEIATYVQETYILTCVSTKWVKRIFNEIEAERESAHNVCRYDII